MSKRESWTLEKANSDLIVWEGESLIAYLPLGNASLEGTTANGQLIIAAPELLQACKAALTGVMNPEHRLAVKAAIAKATGVANCEVDYLRAEKAAIAKTT